MARERLFVDTGAWFAHAVRTDRDHVAAMSVVGNNQSRLITTDFIIDELLTLFVHRRFKHVGVLWLDEMLPSEMVEMVRVEAEDFNEACRIYSQYQDKEWSLTDCTSLAVMRRLGIQTAFSFDEHFRQFGEMLVVP